MIENSETNFALTDAFFAEAIVEARRRLARPVLVGLSGSQGSGKSTTAARLGARLSGAGLAVAVCSLDDFYHTREEWDRLARTSHPLFSSRGVPGTHDLALMSTTLRGLMHAHADSVTMMPVFDKASDERAAIAAWRYHRGSCDVVLLEGWCVGSRPQDTSALRDPVNALEREEDVDGLWRRSVNTHLAGEYARIFAGIDLRLMLRAPSFDVVQGWRAEQEMGISRAEPNSKPPMSAQELKRFIAQYERITRWMMEDEPADLVADLGEDRVPRSWRTASI